MVHSNSLYKIRLNSKKILGPLRFHQVQSLIRKNEIQGNEHVRHYPYGMWKVMHQFPELAEVLVREIIQSEDSFFMDSPPDFSPRPRFHPKIQMDSRVQVIKPLKPQKLDFISKIFFRNWKWFQILKIGEIICLIILISYPLIFFNSFSQLSGWDKKIQPSFPIFKKGAPSIGKSQELYQEAIKSYSEDTYLGYRNALLKFQKSAFYNKNNTQAFTMLATTYLYWSEHFFTSSAQFSMIRQLIDSQKKTPIFETLIAEIHWLLRTNQAHAAQIQLSNYLKIYPYKKMEIEYLDALSYLSQGNYEKAISYLQSDLDFKVTDCRYLYLKGQILEKLGDFHQAILVYKKILSFNTMHAKSHLRLLKIAHYQGKIKQEKSHLDFLLKNPKLLFPRELSSTYFLASQLAELEGSFYLSLKYIKKSVQLDPENYDAVLELYALRAKIRKPTKKIQDEIKMYHFIRKGEKHTFQKDYQLALKSLFQAHQVHPKSALPLIKLGEVFLKLKDIEHAKFYSKLAARLIDKRTFVKYENLLVQLKN